MGGGGLGHLDEYTENRKIKMASSKFDGYVLHWSDNIVPITEENGDPPIDMEDDEASDA
jgi:hypothetical protein